jgi:hypothetical protein
VCISVNAVAVKIVAEAESVNTAAKVIFAKNAADRASVSTGSKSFDAWTVEEVEFASTIE